MEFDRRSVLASTGTVVVAALAGCTGDDDGDEDTGDSDSSDETSTPEETEPTETESDQQASSDDEDGSPAPRIVDAHHPEPRVVSVDNEHQSGDLYDFTVEIENTGAAGDIGATLVWLEDQNSDPRGPNSQPETTHERYFDSDERREITATAEPQDGYDGYGFRVWTAEMGVEIENEGDDGRIELRLMEGDEILDDAELMIDAGETISHEFSGDYSDADPAELDIEVEPAE